MSIITYHHESAKIKIYYLKENSPRPRVHILKPFKSTISSYISEALE